jgi:hypothetical protein
LAAIRWPFGPTDKIIKGHQTAWCLAKISRLIGQVEIPEIPGYKEEFELAAGLATGEYIHPNRQADIIQCRWVLEARITKTSKRDMF